MVRRRAVGVELWFLARGGERDAVTFVSWYSNEGTWFRETW
jgi:hypothetical protein